MPTNCIQFHSLEIHCRILYLAYRSPIFIKFTWNEWERETKMIQEWFKNECNKEIWKILASNCASHTCFHFVLISFRWDIHLFRFFQQQFSISLKNKKGELLLDDCHSIQYIDCVCKTSSKTNCCAKCSFRFFGLLLLVCYSYS